MDTSPDWQPPPVSVGGVAEYPQLEPESTAAGPGPSGPNAVALAGAAVVGALVLAVGGWFGRRRWLR